MTRAPGRTNPGRIRVALIALAGAIALLTAVVAAVEYQRTEGGQKAGGPIPLQVGKVPPEPSIWIDVHAPAKVWRALRSNAWIATALSEPLGIGAGAEWIGFFSTRGGDLANAFEGAVLDLFADRLLADPFRVVFFAGSDATGAPAIVVASPSAPARGAYEVLERVARNGTYEAERCPGPEAKGGRITVSRWLVAEQALFAGRRDDRIALARNPRAVLQALCAAPPDVPPAQGIDVSMSLSRDALGRAAQLGAALLGVGPAPRLAFAIEGDRLVPRGVLGELSEPDRLAAGPPPEPLLRLLPADAGLVFLATLRLPAPLDRRTLAQHLQKTYRGAYEARTVALVWNPRGDEKRPTEVAVAWPERDAALLRDAFSGPNRMERRRACGHEVYASTGELADAMQRACDGKAPSILNAAPAVTSGVRQETSIGLGVNLGVLLSRLLGDAYASAQPAPKGAPEIDAARRLLEQLPFIGLRGVAKAGALQPGGFRS